ncbi:MAG: hypothetical protein ACRD4R_12940 [Candidatus Acidiferrales bacterium]
MFIKDLFGVKGFAALLLLTAPCAFASPKPASASAAPAELAKALPAAPVPKTAFVAYGAQPTNAPTDALLADNAGGGPQNSQELGTIRVPPLPTAKSTRVLGVEAAPSRKTWILLSIADHSAAAFDAYSTRAAISRGAVEADPVIRPFAGSAGIYAAIQVAPVALDFIARKMQRSQSSLLRHTWWLPQSASTGLFLFSGAHNMTVAR